MSSVPSEVSKYMGNAVKLADIWGTLIFNVKASPYNAKGNGTKNETTSIVAAISDAAVTGGIVSFPPGIYLTNSFTVPSNVTLQFANGSKLLINSGQTVSINGPIDAGYYQIFSGSGTVNGLIKSPYMYPQWWGTKGDGSSDDTVALNNTFSTAYSAGLAVHIPAGTYRYREFSPGVGFAVLNRGVSVTGEGKMNSVFAPLPTMPNTASFMLINPIANADISFLELGRFMVYPGATGTKYGGRCIFFNFNVVSNLSKIHIHDLYLAPGNDYSIEVQNAIAVNPQGAPAYSIMENNEFFEGIKLIGVGDSNAIRNNFFNSSVGSGRAGIYLYHVDGAGGVSSHSMITGNAMDCDGGSLQVIRGRNIKFNYNNVEQSHGTGTPNGAVIDIDGSSGTIPFSEVCSNAFGTFGTGSITSMIRINGSLGAKVEDNTIISSYTLASAVSITANATDTFVGRNEVDTTKYTAPVNDLGVGTSGLKKLLSLNGGITNVGGYATSGFYRTKEGSVILKGFVSGASIPSGTLLGTLPVGFRPIELERLTVGALIGGTQSVSAIEISPTTGAITYFGSTATQVVFSGLTFFTQSHISNSL